MTSSSDSYFNRIERAVSQERLGPYRNRAQCPEAEVLANYLWNVSLCESLYPAFHSVEVALRNTIHRAAADLFRSERWFEASYPRLDTREREKVAEAKAELASLWEALEWLSPEFADLLRPFDDFPSVHTAGSAAFLGHTTALTSPPLPNAASGHTL